MLKLSSRAITLVALTGALAACTAQPAAAPTATGTPAAGASVAPAAPQASATPAATASVKASATPAADATESEGCEHMTKGPAAEVKATLAAEGRGVVALDHKRYDVTLAPQGAQFAGSVTLNSAKAGDLVVYLGFEGAASEALPVALYQDGKAIAFESSDPKAAQAACPAIKHKHVAEVGVGPVELRFGPTARAKVSVVLEAGAHEAHDDEHGDEHGDGHDHQ
ncbi:MAG: hypothetical protein VKS61_09745 [Candidatus Sericytochromatia bacterium]|nr:hypothetical protein [Candidatus Sericytochromatia bacterium]